MTIQQLINALKRVKDKKTQVYMSLDNKGTLYSELNAVDIDPAKKTLILVPAWKSVSYEDIP